MNFLSSDELREQQEKLSLINEVLNEKIDTTSLYKLNDLYLYCLKDIGRDNNETYSDLYELVIEKMFIEGYGFNKKTKKTILYNELEKRIYALVDINNDILDKEFKLLIEKGEKTESDYKVFNLMLSALLTGATLKMIERFKDLLPMKRDNKDFKEKYPFLYIIKKKYIEFKNKVMAEQEDKKYCKVHNNEGINEIIAYSPLLNNESMEIIDGKKKLELKTNKGTITLDIDSNKKAKDIAPYIKNNSIGAAEQMLIVHIMTKVFNQLKVDDVKEGCGINIDVREFCEIKEIPFRSEVGSEILKSLDKLSKIIIEYEYTTTEEDSKGKKKVVQKRLKKSPLVLSSGMIETLEDDKKTVKNQSIGVVLGKWIETLNFEQFQYRSKKCFTYDQKNNDNSTFSLSEYINDLHRNNLKNNLNKNQPFKTKVTNLTALLGVNEERIKSKGYTNVLKKPLEKKLNSINEKEGFEWKYKNGNHKSRNDFENDVVIFKNIKLDEHYIKKGFKSSKKRK